MAVEHCPNFNALRLLAASSVVFSHSFLIATGSEETEPLHFTGQVTAVYGVFLFFILSGFLVTESAKRSANVIDYFRKRILRIAPAFIVSTFLITYVICAPFASGGAFDFIIDTKTLNEAMLVIFFHKDILYFANVDFYAAHGEANYLPHLANGVLWTIRLEVIGYTFVGLLMALSLLKGRKQLIAIILTSALIVASFAYINIITSKWLAGFLFVAPSLCCGIAMNFLIGLHRPRNWIAGLFLLGLVPALYYQVLPQAFPFIAAYPLIWLGSVPFRPFAWMGARSDISYGIYLYGWPITQLLRAFLGDDMNGYQLTLMALPLTAFVAFCSWHLIEKPALRFKRTSPKEDLQKVSRQPTARLASK